MSKNAKKAICFTVLASSVMLSGCGLLGGGDKKIDPPQDVTYLKDASGLKEKSKAPAKEAKAEIKTELYLIDKNGYVVPQTLQLPSSEGVAKQALEYLVSEGPVQELLPNGFRAVLPADTKVDLNINKDGVATADFSNEFKNYKAADEKKILQSITWTLTQFDSIKKVNIRMNGKVLTQMPVNHTPITKNLTRTVGINLDTSGITDISNTKAITVYYLGGEEGEYYYVPVTRRITDTKADPVTAAVNELIKGPAFASKLISEFVPEIALLDSPKVDEGKVTLNFNKSVLNSTKNNQISSYLLDSLVLSLTEQKEIKSVEVLVDGKEKLTTDNGKTLTAPVTRPEKVNTGSF
ncbi:germination protein M [Peribacillus deserti]|uniref:Germination protein M n=1 Tax=Peribacillus deserti TaxID=673318 RepID=A0ABS2QFP9_9BACI|nr:GerMN domain-containing protein [Peribacillus deserti]MBM7691982.1 germination protein M [Peribacillus deserti]